MNDSKLRFPIHVPFNAGNQNFGDLWTVQAFLKPDFLSTEPIWYTKTPAESSSSTTSLFFFQATPLSQLRANHLVIGESDILREHIIVRSDASEPMKGNQCDLIFCQSESSCPRDFVASRCFCW
jgi:hypothetical protein